MKEAVSEDEDHDQTEPEGEEAEESANKVEEEPHKRTSGKRTHDKLEALKNYCMLLEEANQALESDMVST